jgi:hypothetical protein
VELGPERGPFLAASLATSAVSQWQEGDRHREFGRGGRRAATAAKRLTEWRTSAQDWVRTFSCDSPMSAASETGLCSMIVIGQRRKESRPEVYANNEKSDA